jgi:probable nitrogen fixation protein
METQEPTANQADDVAAIATPFLKALAGLVRAEDSYGTWDNKRDADLLSAFIVTKEARRAMPIIADPDPDAMHRVEQYYQAVGLVIEQRVGLMASPMMKMSHEGFGRVLLTVGKLVVIAKTLRDVHRFGFDSLAALDREGEKAVAQAAATINQFPEVARA